MFSVRLSSRDCPGQVIVALHGELDLVDASDVAVALAAASSREPLVIVDLAGLDFIDASGVAALARGRDHARGGGGELLLTAPQEQVRRILGIIFPAGDFVLPLGRPDASAGHGDPDPVSDVLPGVPAVKPRARVRSPGHGACVCC